MTFSVSTQDWSPLEWTTKEPGSLGVRLNEAMVVFCGAVNTNPGNGELQLSLLKDHQSATGTTSFGYVLRLGHPLNPVLLRFFNTSTNQTFNASATTANLALGLASTWSDDGLNGGYGTFSATVASINAGMSYYSPTGNPANSSDGRLIVMMDTTPGGHEFFSYNIATTNGDTYAQNHTLILFRSPATSGWNVALLRSMALAGMFESRNFYTWSNDVMVPAVAQPSISLSTEQLLTRGIGLIPTGHGPGQLFAYRSKQERVNLPPLFWFGSNQISAPRRLGRVSNPGGPGTFYQLNAAGLSAFDCWILLPPATPTLAGWNTIGSLTSWDTFPDRLNFAPEVPRGPVLMGPDLGPDFLMDWSAAAMGGPGVAQHPLYAQQQQGSGSRRPTTAVLWPRGTP